MAESTFNWNGTGPYTFNTSPDMTTSHRLTGLLAGDSDYITQARQQAAQQAASRGLQNSTLAAGAGQSAAIAAGLPIAQQEAQAYLAAAQGNQQAVTSYQDTAMQANAQVMSAGIGASASLEAARIRAAIDQQQVDNQNVQFGQNLDWQKDAFGQNLGFQDRQLTQQGDQFGQNLGLNYAQLGANIGEFQSNQNFGAYQFGSQMQQASQMAYQNAFNSIMMNPNMTAEERSSALQNAQDFYAQQSQYSSMWPQFTAPYASDPNYWAYSPSSGYTPTLPPMGPPTRQFGGG